eukprot:403353194
MQNNQQAQSMFYHTQHYGSPSAQNIPIMTSSSQQPYLYTPQPQYIMVNNANSGYMINPQQTALINLPNTGVLMSQQPHSIFSQNNQQMGPQLIAPQPFINNSRVINYGYQHSLQAPHVIQQTHSHFNDSEQKLTGKYEATAANVQVADDKMNIKIQQKFRTLNQTEYISAESSVFKHQCTCLYHGSSLESSHEKRTSSTTQLPHILRLAQNNDTDSHIQKSVSQHTISSSKILQPNQPHQIQQKMDQAKNKNKRRQFSKQFVNKVLKYLNVKRTLKIMVNKPDLKSEKNLNNEVNDILDNDQSKKVIYRQKESQKSYYEFQIKQKEQVRVLTQEFKQNPKWNREKIREIAQRIQMKEIQVYKWNWDQKEREKKVMFLQLLSEKQQQTEVSKLKQSQESADDFEA